MLKLALTIDPVHGLAFIACQGNRKLLVLDLRAMTIASSFPVGAGPDVLAYDAHLGLLFVASESGVLTVFRVAAVVSMAGQGYVGPNAHVVAIDPATHRIYMPLKNVKGQPVLRVLEWTGNPSKGG